MAMMKSLLTKAVLLLCVAVSLPLSLLAQEAWDGTSVDTEWEGLGTAESPYLIGTAAELAGLAKRTNADETFEGVYFRLTADISLSDPAAAPEDKPLWDPIGRYSLINDDPETNPGGWYGSEHWFKGHFDGGGHAIRNLWYTGSTDFDDWNDPFGSGQLDFTAWYKALFGLLDGATVCNLRLEDVNVCGTALIGGLAIRAKNSTLTDIHVSGHVKSGDYAAGGSAAALVVEAQDSRFERCTSSADVFGFSRSGGLIGDLRGASTVVNCSAGGRVTGSVNVGGLIGVSAAIEGDESGAVPTVRLSTSAATVTVISGRNQGNNGGGFIGMNAGFISQCGATGKVNVTTDCGSGFCDTNYGHIESCYSTADVTNDDYGVYLSTFVTNNGIDVGYDSENGTILNCYGVGRLYAPAPPEDLITNGTHICGFQGGNYISAGSYIANCYFDNTKTPEGDGKLDVQNTVPGEYGRPTEFLQSREFVDSLNMMAAVMGTHLWQYNEGGYPTPTDERATDVKPFFDGGKGTEAEPFLIANKRQLENLAYAANHNWEFRGQYLLQTADIALNAPMDTWGEQMPEAWTPIARYGYNTMNGFSHHFSGTYDGGMHTVQNLYMDCNAPDYLGLFGVLGANACIKNLGVVDAWVNGDCYAGILVGGTNLQNDYVAQGPRTISHCWTTGQVTGGYANGGIVGKHWPTYAGEGIFTMVACYSTAKADRGLIGDNYVNDYEVIGCWYGGDCDQVYAFNGTDYYYWTFVDSDKNPVREEDTYNGYPFGRTTAYMQSRQFVNDLNYGAASRGYEGGWCYNDGEYPSYTGEKPTIEVTVNNGIDAPVTFPAMEGSVLTMPATPEREGYVLQGWYTDAEYTRAFAFEQTPVTAPITLYARWMQPVAADYSVFKNKFSNTYTITTAAQLYGLANIINETADGVDWTDFEGKTIKLGADIDLNDLSDYDLWGTSVKPVPFTPIAMLSGYPFQGTFDGQGHTIRGLYIEGPYNIANDNYYGLFACIGNKAVVKNVILDKAYIKKFKGTNTGLLAGESYGAVSRCGVEGKIYNPRLNSGTNGGLIAQTKSGSSVAECYALVDMDVRQDPCGGLIGQMKGTLTDSYARGSVKFGNSAVFGGVVIDYGYDSFTNCYSAMSLSAGTVPSSDYYGGAYADGPYQAAKPNAVYNRELVQSAFDAMSEDYANKAYARGKGLTTVEMKGMAAYEGWDFTTVWGRRNDHNDGYPYLRWTVEQELDNDIDVGIGHIDGDATDTVHVYTLQGALVYKGSAAEANLPSGIYIVRRGKEASKVIIP